jgi:hypothetical protein
MNYELLIMNCKLSYLMGGILLGCALIFGSGCGGKEDAPHVSDDQLARMTADLFVVESATANLSGVAKDSLYQAYAAQMFELHGVNKDVYEKKLMEVALDLDRMENMAAKVEELLKAEQVEKPATGEAAQDSIKNGR